MKLTKCIFLFLLIINVLISSCNKKNEKDSILIFEENILLENIIIQEIDFEPEKIRINDFLESYIKYQFFSLDIMEEADYNWRWGIILIFNYNGNNNFAFIPDGPPYTPWVTGEYIIENEQIILNPIFYENFEYIYDVLKEKWLLEYVSIENSSFYVEGLIGNGIVFGARNNIRPKSGELRNVNGVNIILDNYLLYKLDENTYIRKGPGMDHESINYFDMEILQEFEYIPESKEIYIIGRTEYKETYNSIEGYWYYCHIVRDYHSKYEFGWIFGLDR